MECVRSKEAERWENRRTCTRVRLEHDVIPRNTTRHDDTTERSSNATANGYIHTILSFNATCISAIILRPVIKMAFLLPLATHAGGRKTLCLRGIWRAPRWRNRIEDIQTAIYDEQSLDTVEISELNNDVDRFQVFYAVLRNPRVKVLKFIDGPVDSDTVGRVLETETLQRVTFYNVQFTNVDEVAREIQSNCKNVEYLSFHWDDGGELANAVTRSLRFHSSWKTLRLFMPSSIESAQTPSGHWSIHLKKKKMLHDKPNNILIHEQGIGWLGSFQ